MPKPFKPVLYMKQGCPHCFKLQLFLLEAGLLGDFEPREWTPGDEAEAAIKAELAPHFDKVTFPTAQIAPGIYQNESDALVNRYADEAGVDPQSLTLFKAWTGKHHRLLKEFKAENKALKAELGRE